MATNNACDYSPVQYSTLTGGANGTINNVSPGTAGQVLTSNGASAQPTFEDAAAGGSYQLFVQPQTANLTASTTYYLTPPQLISNATNIAFEDSQFLIPVSGTITTCYGITRVSSTLSSSQNSTLSILVNGGGATDISTAIEFDTADTTFSNTGLSIAVSAGDYLQFRLVTGAFTTNPLNANLSFAILIS